MDLIRSIFSSTTSKVVMGLTLILLCFSVKYVNWQNDKIDLLQRTVKAKQYAIEKAEQQLAVAQTTLKHVKEDNERINKVNQSNSRKIATLTRQNKETTEKLYNEIKKSQCANVLIPDSVINILRGQANSANQSIDTGQPDAS